MNVPALAKNPLAGAYALELLYAIGSGLSKSDQEWLSNNLAGLPDYFRSAEGAKVMASVVKCYKMHSE
jgi:hypothetical protein